MSCICDYYEIVVGLNVAEPGRSVLVGKVGTTRDLPVGLGPDEVLAKVQFSGKGVLRCGGGGGCGGGRYGCSDRRRSGGKAGDKLPGGVRSGCVGDF